MSNKSFQKNVVQVVAAACCALALWYGLGFLLATGHGLDLTDEGLYLLAADSHGLQASWGFPFGWHTDPLFHLAGYDVAAFRSLGATILVICGCGLGWLAAAAGVEIFSGSDGASARSDQMLKWIGAATGGVGSLLYYAGLLSTPSYNWVNLVGITIAAGGWILLARCAEKRGPNQKIHEWLGILAVGFGLFFSLPGKPSTAPAFFLGGAVFLILFRRDLRAFTLLAAAGVVVLFWVFAATVAGFWKWPFLDFFILPFQKPLFTDRHSILGAIRDFFAVPMAFTAQFFALGYRLQLLAAAACVFLVSGCVAGRRRPRVGILLATAGWAFAFFVFLRVCAVVLPRGAKPEPLMRFLFEPTVTALIFVWVCCMALAIVAICFPARSCVSGRRGMQVVKIGLLGGFLAALPFVFGFGSDNGVYRQSALAAGFFPVAAVAFTAAISSAAIRLISAGMVLLCTCALVAATLWDSHALPYRQEPMAWQNTSLSVGPGGGRLKVDEKLASQIESLRKQATLAGWRGQTPLFGVVWDWASTVPYLLGARVPDCQMVTLFRYPGSVSVAKYNIKNSLGDFPSESAWILTNVPGRDPGLYNLNPGPLDEKSQAEVNEVLAEAASAGGREFPADYEIAAETIDYQLWKPVEKSN
jgi:hypothetical protein